MKSENHFYQYQPDGKTFISHDAVLLRMLYAPLCGTDSRSIKSSITPFLSGDIKIDKNSFLTKPASREDLRADLRNFFVQVKNEGTFSLTQKSTDKEDLIEIGMLWHRLVKKDPVLGIELEAVNFVPVAGGKAELMRVKVTNVSKKKKEIIPTFSIPLFARALNNKHDHEHVTSLLHRTEQAPQGVLVEPTMVFNEEKHVENNQVYFVLGATDNGQCPVGSFPTRGSFYGESADNFLPEAVERGQAPAKLEKQQIDGKESVGALRFENIVLAPGKSKEYFIVIGAADNRALAEETFQKFSSREKFAKSLDQCKQYWEAKAGALKVGTADKGFDSWMQWVTLQPVLRRIYGCSFLPDHDYGKGGRGWRDIWQDLLALLLVESEMVRDHLINNFCGVRIDGSNATIIGEEPGQFIADRNNISRVWMDHGAWPFLMIALYIEQTGDQEILLEKISYFKDAQLSRSFERDLTWTEEIGNQLQDQNKNSYCGSVIEHLLVQHLVQFFNVGEHNIIRLESADWNDGLDMAFERGESVAFTCLYGGNLLRLAELFENLKAAKGIHQILLAKEMTALLDTLGDDPCDYNDPGKKRERIFQKYFPAVQPEVSGEQVEIAIDDLVSDLRQKGEWIFEHIRRKEKISVPKGEQTYTWFNGYYDNVGKKVEGEKDGNIQMTLTGQVFAVMSGLAEDQDVLAVDRSVRAFLKDKELGGLRLNTDFQKRNYLELGRAFSFAYGTKENGAFFSHMAVMYAYALYLRGFAREGFDVLHAIYAMSTDTEKSKIYPGIPEYFDSQGRGMYPYLTGAASWYILTILTQVFGVRGEGGDLVLEPKLVKEQFDSKGEAKIDCQFAGKKLSIVYENKKSCACPDYAIQEIKVNGDPLDFERISDKKAKIPAAILEKLPESVSFKVVLAA